MKKITFLLMCVCSLQGFSQSLPLDFEVPEDNAFNAFNGTVATVVEDPTDASNTVLEMIGAGNDFDGAAITLDTYVDLSDDANNSITMRVWAPDGDTRTHLLKFEGGSSGATEMVFMTNMAGWQDVTVDFGAGLGNEYPTMVLFTDSTAGNTATGTYYFDDIDGPNGEMVPTDPIPEGPAPDPTSPADEVLKIYTDFAGYESSSNWVPDYDFGTVTQVDLGTSGTNNAYKFNFQAAGYGQGTNDTNLTDVSTYGFVNFDYWADANSTEVRFFLIENEGGTVSEFFYQVGNGGDEAIVTETWTTVSIPMVFFEDAGFTTANFFQWKMDVSSNEVSEIVYVDNIYFAVDGDMEEPTCDDGIMNGDETGVDCGGSCEPCTEEPSASAEDPTIDEENVLSVYSETYTTNVVENFNLNAFQGTGTISEVDIESDGNNTIKIEDLSFYGAQWDAEDVSSFNFVHFDYYATTSTAFNFYLVDETAAIPGGAPEEPRYSIGSANADEEIVQGEWRSVFIPLQHFLDYDSGGFNYDLDDIFQYKFDGNGNLYIDNVYFSTESLSVGENSALRLSAYPNPSSDRWMITTQDEVINSIRVYDVTGKQVMKLSPESNSYSLDGSALSTGLYFAKVTTSQGESTLRLIKR